MSTDHYLFPYLLTKDRECFCMNILFSYMNVAYTIYHTGGSLLRYWYVKASLRPEVAEVFMRKKHWLSVWEFLKYYYSCIFWMPFTLTIERMSFLCCSTKPALILNQTTQFHFISLCLSKLFRCTSI